MKKNTRLAAMGLTNHTILIVGMGGVTRRVIEEHAPQEAAGDIAEATPAITPKTPRKRRTKASENTKDTE